MFFFIFLSHSWLGDARDATENVVRPFGDPRENENRKKLVIVCMDKILFIVNT